MSHNTFEGHIVKEEKQGFCTECGLKLAPRIITGGYSFETGELITETIYDCPTGYERLLNYHPSDYLVP